MKENDAILNFGIDNKLTLVVVLTIIIMGHILGMTLALSLVCVPVYGVLWK